MVTLASARTASIHARRPALTTAWLALIISPLLMWLIHHGLHQTLDRSQAARTIALSAGLLASIFMVVQVVLIARIPLLEQTWGHDLLARRHRWLGFWSFWLMILHITVETIEHLQRRPDAPRVALLDLFVWRWWLLLATIGSLLIAVVVVTSTRWARRKMRYETWHLVHLNAYAGMGFALPHQILHGPDFHGAGAQFYWWTIYSAAIAAILIFRVGMPLYRSVFHRLRVDTVTFERPGVVSVTMSGRHLNQLRARSGQFFIWRFLDGPHWWHGHPFSLSDTPTDTALRVTVQACGDGSTRLAELRPGTRVAIEGPYGTMTLDRRENSHVVFLAAGLGIAPLRALMSELQPEAGHAHLIYRCTLAEQQIFVDELDALADTTGIQVSYLTGPRRDESSWLPAGHTGGDVDVLSQLVPAIGDSDVYLCGPGGWLRAARAAAIGAGVHRKHIHSEEFAW
ncbi:putative ferric reductase [Mycobacterium sp. MAA66]|uniref:ferredoxin reductase family protein n=1 Tax=Mycobacterium sp. MAA66 TaxID=3156297 RepID=UPI003515EA28